MKNKKKKPQIGYAEFNMEDFARKIVLGRNLSPSSREIKETIEKRNNNEQRKRIKPRWVYEDVHDVTRHERTKRC